MANDNVKVFASTFNCAKSFPFADKTALEDILQQLIPYIGKHDVYILGFQELVPIWQGSFPNMVLGYLQQFADLVLARLNTDDRKYKPVDVNCLGAIGIMVFCSEEYEVTNIMKCNVRCGAYYSSLKGASAIRFSLIKENNVDSFTGVSCHLAANEGAENLEKRVQDYDTIMGSLRDEFGEMEHNHVFFTGDFNFRLNKLFGDIDYKDPDIIDKLLQNNDELGIVMRTERAFAQFKEPPINYPPTFKFVIPGSDDAGDPLSYNMKRQPSWCDRIVHSPYEFGANVDLYKAIPRTKEFYFTDHQPVVLSMQVPHVSSEVESRRTLSKSPTSSSSSLSLSFGRMVDVLLGYSGWLYFEHSRTVLLGLLVISIYYWII